jgi:hypothetical protein
MAEKILNTPMIKDKKLNAPTIADITAIILKIIKNGFEVDFSTRFF